MKRLFVVACFVALALPSVSANDQRARVVLQAAEVKAKVEGDFAAAVKLYKDAEREAGSNRALVAQALVKMADAYQKLGDKEAQRIYQRLVADFADQKESVAIARARLEPANVARRGATLQDVAGLNPSGNVTADGRYAVYVNWDTGNIALRDLLSGTAREMTARTDYDVYDPVVSRDGRFVAYQSFNTCIERKSTSQRNGALCVLPVAGEPAATAKTVFGSDDDRDVKPMDWSPDGNSIAVVLRRQDGTAQIGIVRIADGKMNVLQSTDWRGATRVFFSPDGRDVAFDVPVNDSSDELDIRVVAVDGSRGSTPVHDPSQNIIMGWAPDGRHVLFASDRTGTLGLWAQRLTDGKADGPSRMVHAGLGGAWSLGITKTGSLYFGVQSGDRDVEVLNVDLKTGKQTSSSARPITRFVGTNWMPEWSRDGRFLAYASRRSVSGNGGHIIGIRDSSTGTVRELRPKVTYLEGLAWSPDGKTLLTNATDFKGRSGVSTIDVGTGDVGFVVAGRFPKFGPDGSRIYYVTPGNGGPNSVIERVLSSGAERTISKGDFVSFTLSPDGRWLAVTRGISDAVTQDLAVVSVESGEVRPVYRAQPGERIPPFIGLPWTPDGQAVLMRKRSPPNELWVVPVTGEPPYRVNAEVEGWSFGSAGVISLHPDGRQIAATRVRQDTGAAVRVLENFLSVLK